MKTMKQARQEMHAILDEALGPDWRDTVTFCVGVNFWNYSRFVCRKPNESVEFEVHCDPHDGNQFQFAASSTDEMVAVFRGEVLRLKGDAVNVDEALAAVE